MTSTKFTFLFFLLLAGFCIGCSRRHYESTPNGDMDTGESRFYPAYEVIRSKKQLYLPLGFQENLMSFYRKKGYWPSLRTFTEESSANRAYVQQLYKQGFTWLEFIPVGTDTLSIAFNFETSNKIKFNQDVGLNVHNPFTGQFLFVAKPIGEIICQKQIDSRKKSR